MATVAVPKLGYSSGAIEGLKYLALISMFIDHVNKAFFDSSLGWAVPIGRLAMPIFTFVLAYNCARPGTNVIKVLRRLLFFGVLALPFQSVINGGQFMPLNVLFTFAAGLGSVLLFRRGAYWSAALVFVGGGLFVDYAWSGVALFVTLLWFCEERSRVAFMFSAAALFGMCVFVGNYWAFLAIVPLVAALFVSPTLPRLRWLFWWVYPVHFAALWLLSRV